MNACKHELNASYTVMASFESDLCRNDWCDIKLGRHREVINVLSLSVVKQQSTGGCILIPYMRAIIRTHARMNLIKDE